MHYFDGIANRWGCGQAVDGVKFDGLPDYLNDLNAVHEAEKVLTDEQFWDYGRELSKVTGADFDDGRSVLSATAAERTEALLKTLRLWRD